MAQRPHYPSRSPARPVEGERQVLEGQAGTEDCRNALRRLVRLLARQAAQESFDGGGPD